MAQIQVIHSAATSEPRRAGRGEMIGPGLEFMRGDRCVACFSQDRPLFNVDVSQLRDYAMIFTVCRYCHDRLKTTEGRRVARDQWPFRVVNAHGWRTTRARQKDIADHVASRTDAADRSSR